MAIKKYQVARYNSFKLKVMKKNESGEVIKEMYIPFGVVDGMPGVAVVINPDQQEMIENSGEFLNGKVFLLDQPNPTVKKTQVDGEDVYQVEKASQPKRSKVPAPKIVSFDPDEFDKKDEPALQEEVKDAGDVDLRFVDIENANAASSAIREAYGIPFKQVQGKEKLRVFAEENNISLPKIFN